MKKIALIITSCAFLLLLSQTGLFSDILLFFLVGAIPGTTHSLPPSIMLLLIIACGWLLLAQFAAVRTMQTLLFTKLRSLLTASIAAITKRRVGEA